MTIPQSVRELCERFTNNRDAYMSAGYKEAQLRQEFINPLFEALGWDVQNRNGSSELYKDVVHEEAIKIGGMTKAPDYSFRVGGRPVFFVEVKKPSVRLKDDPEAAFQLRRYAWSAKLPVSILTDFEEFAVYDTRVQPKRGDKASVARVRYEVFADYESKWDDLAALFSKEAVLKGGLDRFVQSKRLKKGTSEVDRAFLLDIEEWRSELAKNLAARNTKLDVRGLNFAVQRIIDRIVFLRICEDRGVETYGQLQALENGGNSYERLREIFEHADDRYNSGLFHFRNEKDRHEPPDELTLRLKVDDDVIKIIIAGLYYPRSPYEFSFFPADILGQVYEQFLGKVIRLTEGHHAKVEDKPEVKKAGGVYYTPTYIVDYIVKHTLGTLLEGKSPKEASKLTVLDPACGSGSFLIGAYQYLLDWHLEWYLRSGTEKHKKEVFQGPGGTWRLTTTERKRILLNSIFGVDIDNQAVEVTKLSLLLKVLEGESAETINQQLKLFHERALPDLGENIKCGNSLIGSDFYDGNQGDLLQGPEQTTTNAFDWQAEFPPIVGAPRGGFDAVIGNPPYVRSQLLDQSQKEYFAATYEAAAYQPDLFAFFLERGVKLLRRGGRLAFILPNGILTNTYYAKLRRFLLDSTIIDTVVDLKHGVFSKVAVDTSILVLQCPRTPKEIEGHLVAIGESPAGVLGRVEKPLNVVAQAAFREVPDLAFNTQMDMESLSISRKMLDAGNPLEALVDIRAGMKVRKEFVATAKKNAAYKKFVVGADVRPYALNWSGHWVCYDRSLESRFSNQAFRDEGIFTADRKLFVRQVMGPSRIYACLDENRYYADQSLYLLLPKSESPRLEELLAIICSRAMAFFFSHTLSDGKETFPKIKGAQIAQLPIPELPGTAQKELNRLVSGLIEVRQREGAAKTGYDKESSARKGTVLDMQIDRLVFQLFGLTEAEIGVVERATKGAQDSIIQP